MSGSLKIKTIVRLRPSIKTEQPDNGIVIDSPTSLSVVNPRNPVESFRFKYQSVYGPGASQEDIWDKDVQELLDHVWEGLTVTVFAYGVTSSGKTHTIQGTKADPGIIPRVVDFLFQNCTTKDRITMSYMEIYRDEVYDLLNGGASSPKLPVREDRDGKVVVQNLTEMHLSCVDDFNAIFSTAAKCRSVGATNLNHASSRSHAILCLNIARAMGETTLIGSINLVDLAGSENNKLTGNDPARMLESSAINKSLAVLGQVVFALNQGASRIPYRDSKLTRILQDALGGGSVGLLICNLAPGSKFRTDTLNTLNFASRTREIENKLTVNEKDNRPQPKAHFAAVQPSKPTAAPRASVAVSGPTTSTGLAVPSGSSSRPSLAPPRPSSSTSTTSRTTSRSSILPRSGRNSALDDAEVRAREREEIERRVRAEAEKDRQRLEAQFAEKERELAERERLRQKEIAMEKEREAAKEREKRLEAELEAQRDLNRQREQEMEEERARIRQKETEEILTRAREDMEARISRAVEEEVKRRMDDLQAQREAEAAAVAAASAAVTPSDSSFGSSSAHDMDSEVKKRLDALEAQYALQRADAKELDNMSSKARRDMAGAFLNVARQYHDKQDWQTALVFYRRCQSFVPDNAKLRARIQEVEIAIEKEKQGVTFSPVKQSGKGSKRQPSPALVPGFGKEAQNMDLDDPAGNDFEFDFQQLRQTRQGKATKNQKKRSRGEAAPAPPTIEEESSDIEVDVILKEDDGDEDGAKPVKKKKRTIGSWLKGKAKAKYDLGSGDENEPPVMSDEDEDGKARSGKSKGRKGKKVKA
ncbi:hypothetical protein M407DRAFT_25405 [Tulasnella calospora MUT 4182]|uniref:Kinesin-like protein n=1 Tax=Tulasnella calospora MUT 4182 TaxID=1051891 RepID=A0A0C3KUV9_9AGAM|nr:hypothetical protein M407DRAFT_25405 [Tulasnella calospora MUT 4182]